MPHVDNTSSARRALRRGCIALIAVVATAAAGCGAGQDAAPLASGGSALASQVRQTERLQLFVARRQERDEALRSLQRQRDRGADELAQLAGLNQDETGDSRYGSSLDGDPSPWVQRGPDATPAPDSNGQTIARVMAATASGRIGLVGAAKREEVTGGLIDDRLLRLLLVLSQRHRLTVSSLRVTHPENVQDRLGSAVPSNHVFGRAADIAAVDGVSCAAETRHARYRTVLDNPPPAHPGPCLSLAYEAAAVPGAFSPGEIIYYWRVPGPAGVSLQNHDDHVHLGYRSYGSQR